jgi:hypothetical protein
MNADQAESRTFLFNRDEGDTGDKTQKHSEF